MPMLEFVGQSKQDGNHISANTSRLVNCYRVPVMGVSPYVIRAVLGEVSYADTGNVFMRDMLALGDTLYASSGGELFSVSMSGAVLTLGNVVNDESNLSTNNGVLTLAGSGDYYTWDGATLAQPTTLFSPGSVTFSGQRTVITEYGGRRFQWSDLADPDTFDPLNFATKEARDDNLLRGIAHGGRVYLMGERSIEVWSDTGLSGSEAFQRIPGAVYDKGLKSYGLVSVFDDGIYFIGDDGVAYIMSGGQMVAVSSRSMEAALEDGTPTRCFYYEDEGQKHIGTLFRNRPAWIFDMATNEWHERGRGVTLSAWDVVATAKRGDTWYTATDAGAINYLARVNADPADPLRRLMVSNTLYVDGRRPILAELEVFPNSGNHDLNVTESRVFALADSNNAVILDSNESALGVEVSGTFERDAMCSLRVSKDGGHHWSPIKDKSMGALGRYDKRTIWRALGQGRQFTAEVSCSEPADVEFQSQCRVRLA